MKLYKLILSLILIIGSSTNSFAQIILDNDSVVPHKSGANSVVTFLNVYRMPNGAAVLPIPYPAITGEAADGKVKSAVKLRLKKKTAVPRFQFDYCYELNDPSDELFIYIADMDSSIRSIGVEDGGGLYGLFTSKGEGEYGLFTNKGGEYGLVVNEIGTNCGSIAFDMTELDIDSFDLGFGSTLNSESSTSKFTIDNFFVEGVIFVPEPSTLVLMLVGLFGLGFIKIVRLKIL